MMRSLGRWGVALIAAAAAHLVATRTLADSPASGAAGSVAPPVDEIIVTGGRLAGARAGAILVGFNEPEIVATRAISLDQLLAFAPAAAVQTNSRGETLVYLRGAGERQTAVFFGGAPINIPWDNRLNLDVFPTGAASDIHITSGPASVLYGANTAGGVIEVSPASFSLDPRAAFDVQAGAGGLRAASALGAAAQGPAEVVAAAGHLTRDGQPLSEDAAPPFFQDPDALRTNTDLERTNGLVRVAFDQSGPLAVSATALVVDSQFGIAPEGAVDPAIDPPRFWRYPENRTLIAVANAGYARAGFDLAVAAWGQRYRQVIESFASEAYSTLEDRQTDQDRAFGVRAVARQSLGTHTLSGAVSAQDARHRQIDETFAPGEALTSAEDAVFRRRTYSLGAEYEAVRGDVSVVLGAGGDVVQSLETGGRPSDGGFAAWSVIAAAEWRATDRWSLSAAAGRKPRLPTQRELFGEAIDRFVLNPDLTSETAMQLEASARYAGERITLTATPFGVITDDTIDQETVRVDGALRRRRINLNGTRAFGADITGALALTDALSLTGHVSVLNLRRRADEGDVDDERFIAERPSLLGEIAAVYRARTGLGVRVEARRRGRAYAAVEDGFVALPRATSVNAEASFATPRRGPAALEVFVRVDNLTDARIEPQLGLPAPGRWVRGGVRLALE